jgi:phosphopantetheine--protein transferase-like protein
MAIHNGHARWAFDLSKWRPNLEELLLATTCIQPEEKIRLIKFVFRDDFDASLIGRLLMRKFVRDATGVPYNAIKFSRDDRGKPFLIEPGPSTDYHVDFNVSHQGCYSVLAGFIQKPIVDSSLKIGVDVMKIQYSGGKPLNEFFRLMNRNFSNDEWMNINRTNKDSDRLKTFMRHWCLKESYVKNIGTGITVDLRKISFHVRTPETDSSHVVEDTLLELNGEPKHDWTFEESQLDDEHCVAVSLNRRDVSTRAPANFELVSFDELLRSHVPLLSYDIEYCKQVLKNEYKNDTI